MIFIRAHWYNLHIALLVSWNCLFILYSEIQYAAEKNQKHKLLLFVYVMNTTQKINKGGFVMHRQHNNEIVLQCLLQPWSVFGATTHRPWYHTFFLHKYNVACRNKCAKNPSTTVTKHCCIEKNLLWPYLQWNCNISSCSGLFETKSLVLSSHI